MPAKKRDHDKPLIGAALIKETCRRIRVARSLWDAHKNPACRGEREKAMALYNTLSEAEREKVPQVLRVWLPFANASIGTARRECLLRRARTLAPNSSNREYEFGASGERPRILF